MMLMDFAMLYDGSMDIYGVPYDSEEGAEFEVLDTNMRGKDIYKLPRFIRKATICVSGIVPCHGFIKVYVMYHEKGERYD